MRDGNSQRSEAGGGSRVKMLMSQNLPGVGLSRSHGARRAWDELTTCRKSTGLSIAVDHQLRQPQQRTELSENSSSCSASAACC